MDSESSQDAFIFLKDGEKDLMAYEEEDMLAFEEAEDSDLEHQSEPMVPGHNPSTRPRLDGEGLMPPVGATTPQLEELEAVDTFETPGVDFDFRDGSALSISGVSMPSQKVVISNHETREAAVKAPSELPDMRKNPAAPQNETSESEQSKEVSNDPSQPPRGASPEHQLQLFHTDQMVCHAISIRECPDTSENRDHNRMIQEHFAFNGIDIASQLLEAAAAQMEPRVIVNESTLMAIANGLQLSMEYGSEVGNPLIEGIGRMVADILLDSQTGIVLGFAVARLVPHPIVNNFGDVQGSVVHQVTRGFAIDDNSRRILTEAVGSAIMMVNQIACE